MLEVPPLAQSCSARMKCTSLPLECAVRRAQSRPMAQTPQSFVVLSVTVGEITDA